MEFEADFHLYPRIRYKTPSQGQCADSPHTEFKEWPADGRISHFQLFMVQKPTHPSLLH